MNKTWNKIYGFFILIPTNNSLHLTRLRWCTLSRSLADKIKKEWKNGETNAGLGGSMVKRGNPNAGQKTWFLPPILPDVSGFCPEKKNKETGASQGDRCPSFPLRIMAENTGRPKKKESQWSTLPNPIQLSLASFLAIKERWISRWINRILTLLLQKTVSICKYQKFQRERREFHPSWLGIRHQWGGIINARERERNQAR